MSRFESLVIVGPSFSGKTTVVNGLRKAEKYADRLSIPPRLITRPGRKTESMDIQRGAYAQGVNIGSIWPYWGTTLDADYLEQYGFVKPQTLVPPLVVYSANNAFFRDQNPSTERVLKSALTVFVMADEETRAARSYKQSPDMSDAERTMRLEDGGQDILYTGLPIEIIDTTSFTHEEGQLALQAIVDKVMGER